MPPPDRYGRFARREFRIAAGPIAELIGTDEALYLAAGIVATCIVVMLLTRDIRRLQAGAPATTMA